MPPRKGYAEVFAHNDQPRFTSSGMLNVMILEPIQERFRIAQRMGVGKYDLYDFHTGGPYSFSTIVIPSTGGNVTVNLPPRGCFTMTASTHDTVTMPADCQSGSFTFPASPNNTGGTLGGNLTFTGSGGGSPISIPTTQPPVTEGEPTPDPAKPWLQLKTCVGNELVDKWIHQSVLGVHNALPAYMHEGTCYQVSGKRSETGGALNIQPYDATKVFETCLACQTGKMCFYRWKKEYNCDTETWGETTEDATYPKCLLQATIDPVNEWFTDGTTTLGIMTYYYYKKTTSCTETANCSETWPDAPSNPVVTPPCPPAHSCCACGPCCISSTSTIDVSWDLQGTNVSCEALDGVRTGSMTGLTLTSYNCTDGEFTDSPTWSKTVGGVEVTVTLTCGETPSWQVAISDGTATVEMTNAEGGDCCGFAGTSVQMLVSPACSGDNDGNSITVTVQNNNCCKDGGSCSEAPGECDGTCSEAAP